MPIYQVLDPETGTELELEGDSPPTEQELEEIFSSLPKPKSGLQKYVTDPINEAVSAVNRGVVDTVDFLASPLTYAIGAAKEGTLNPTSGPTLRGALKDTPLSVEGGYMDEGLARDVIRTAGGVVAPGVAGGQALRQVAQQLPSLAARSEGVLPGVIRQVGQSTAAQDAALSAASGAGSAVGGEAGEMIGGETGRQVGTMAGAILAPASLAVTASKLAPAKGAIQSESGEITPDSMAKIQQLFTSGADEATVNQRIAAELTNSGVLTPEQASRFNLFTSRGIRPTRADVTQNTSDFRELQDAVKKSGPVAQAVAEQDEQLFKLVRDGVENIGPSSSNIVETNNRVFSAVDKTVTDLDNKVFEAYSAAREVAKGQPRVTLENTLKTLNDSRGSENITGGVISAMRGILKNKGLLRAGENIDINKRGARTGADQTRKLTVTEAEEIRQSLNQLFDSATPQGKRVIRALKDSIDEDVAAAVGDDIFKEARQAKVNFHSKIERGRRNKFDATKGSFLEDIIDNSIPEEKIVPRLISGRDDDFIAMKRFLTKDAGPEGLQAFNDIKAQVLRGALDKAITQGKTEGGQAVFNANSFKRELEGLRKTKKWGELFNKDEQKLIDDIIEIGRLRIPQRAVAQGSGPSAGAIQEVSKEIRRDIVKAIPLVGEKAQALIDALTSSGAAKRQLNPLKETSQAINYQGGRVFDQVVTPALTTAIQDAQQPTSPPTNF